MIKYYVLLFSTLTVHSMVHEKKLLTFFSAIAENDIPQVCYLLKEDATYPKQISDTGTTALCYARTVAMANLLVENGADPLAISADGSTTLMWAASGDYEKEDALIDLLLQNGVAINTQGPQQKTALIIAAKWNNISKVKALIDAGADIFIKDAKKRSARSRIRRMKPKNDQEKVIFQEILQIVRDHDFQRTRKKTCVVQ